MLGSLGSSVAIHWNGHNSMMQMVSFNFWFWFVFWCSFKRQISPEIHLFYSDWTLCPYERCMMGSLGNSVVIHWFVHISMMQMVYSISGFDSVSGAHFSQESVQRFIYFIQIGHFVLSRRVCLHQREVVLYFTDLDISLWCRWFLSISGFDSVSGAHFSQESVQRFIYSIQIGHIVLMRRVWWDHWEIVL